MSHSYRQLKPARSSRGCYEKSRDRAETYQAEFYRLEPRTSNCNPARDGFDCLRPTTEFAQIAENVEFLFQTIVGRPVFIYRAVTKFGG
ncbi:MAG: hypothetical protein DWI29_05270 [Planctomycetota bacterium]|nr:MAG: hypothetical protein DWI29_05270 [Planctomycetota bacterium]